MAQAPRTLTLHTAAQDAAAARMGMTLTRHGGGQVIDVREPQEVSAWTSCLGCTEERLRLAVAAVGPELEAVCDHLGTLLPARALDRQPGNGTAH